MTREDVFEMVNRMANTCIDQPFEGDFDTFALRHADTKKWFGLIIHAPQKYFYGQGEGEVDTVMVKCDPVLRDLLMQNYHGIYPAWHMNKVHWASIVLNDEFPYEQLEQLLYHSFDLTGKKKK